MNKKQKNLLGGSVVVLILAAYATWGTSTAPGLLVALWSVLGVVAVAVIVAYRLAGRHE
ncbi:hypothetical protein [Glutamicibacter sp. X7]